MSIDQPKNKEDILPRSKPQKNNAQENIQGKESEANEEIVVLRPIVKVMIVLLFILLCGLAFMNLVHSFHKINHPNPAENKSTLTTASILDTGWYSEEKIRVKDPHRYSDTPQSGTSPHETQLTAHNSTESFVDEETQKAMTASISSNQITADLAQDNVSKVAINDRQDAFNEKKVGSDTDSDAKEAFSRSEMNKKSPYILHAGTMIPGILITGISSSLPGQVSAQVRSNVYDSLKFRYLLIPQGSKLIGSYDSKICFGQKRLFVIWQRIILPNGDSINLGETPSGDSQGMSGFKDSIDNHYGTLLGSALLLSVLSSGAQLASPSDTTPKLNPASTLSQSVGLHIAETGSQLISKAMEVQPTLTIRPGYLFNITVTKDILFDQPYF